MGRLVTQVPPECQALVDDYLVGGDGRLQVRRALLRLLLLWGCCCRGLELAAMQAGAAM
jgi:hypothetical protein